MDNYGIRLRQARKNKGLTQTELANRLGITQKSYQRMETGVHDLKMSTISQLCYALDISADWLLGINNAGIVPLDNNSIPGENIKTWDGKKVPVAAEVIETGLDK